MLLFDLSDRVKIRLHGSDRVRFLNGQVTNDVRKAKPNLSLPACLLNAKGKLDAFLFVTAGPEEFFLDANSELHESLPLRLERYIIADDVVVEDVSGEYSLFHVTGEMRPNLPNDAIWREARRFGVPGWDIWVVATEHDRVRSSLAADFSLCDANCAERLRIEQGIPRWGRELTDQIIPVEANLADEAIDYEKGCYIGQEVISRMKMSGQLNKRLCGLISVTGTPLAAPMRLVNLADEKDAGWLTSATRSERFGEIALAYVKRGFNEPATELNARAETAIAPADSIRVKVVELPFR